MSNKRKNNKSAKSETPAPVAPAAEKPAETPAPPAPAPAPEQKPAETPAPVTTAKSKIPAMTAGCMTGRMDLLKSLVKEGKTAQEVTDALRVKYPWGMKVKWVTREMEKIAKRAAKAVAPAPAPTPTPAAPETAPTK